MKQPIWLLPEVVIALQEALVAEFGGDAGLRDSAMLDSALARPVQRVNIFTLALLPRGKPSTSSTADEPQRGIIAKQPSGLTGLDESQDTDAASCGEWTRLRFNYDPAADPFELAAAYAFGLARNYPFIDGNKRIAFVASIVFLETNGQTFAASQADAVVQTLGLAAGAVSESEYATWLRANAKQANR